MLEPPFGSATLDRYHRLEIIGHGAYGKVYMAVDQETQERVALKKITLDIESEGVPSVALREICLLRELNCPNIVCLKNVISTETRLYLVFEYVDQDLKRFLDSFPRNEGLPAATIKNIMFQLLSALSYLHSKRVIHRDLKPQNVLLSKKNQVKLADFGLARAYQIPIQPYTHDVVTLWYRPPELLLGALDYSPAVDIWAAGAIFAEIAMKNPLFPGDSEFDQLYRIFRTKGTPTERIWPGVSKLKNYKKSFPDWPLTVLRVPGLDYQGLDLLEKMMKFYPAERLTAKEALEHPYFLEGS